MPTQHEITLRISADDRASVILQGLTGGLATLGQGVVPLGALSLAWGGLTGAVNIAAGALSGVATFLSGGLVGAVSSASLALSGLATYASGGMVAALGTASGAVGGLSGAFDGVVGAVNAAWNRAQAFINWLASVYVPDPFAGIGTGGGGGGGGTGGFGANWQGTNAWEGGSTWVGERGPELVTLPRGSQILDHRSSKRAASMASPGLAIENHFHVSGDVDYEQAARRVAELLAVTYG